jgi:spore coat protein CotH
VPHRTGSPRALRLRQDWPLVGTCCALVSVVTGIFGSTQVRPWATSSATSRTDEDVVTQDITGKLDLFDQDVGHTIALRFDEKRYQEMVSAYSEDGEKEQSPQTCPSTARWSRTWGPG